jgi:choline-glycine betaine transporter
MPGVLGLSLLVVVSVVGLVVLALRGSAREHLAAMAVVLGLGFALLLTVPVVGLTLLTAAEATRRMATRPRVPDRLPSTWA